MRISLKSIHLSSSSLIKKNSIIGAHFLMDVVYLSSWKSFESPCEETHEAEEDGTCAVGQGEGAVIRYVVKFRERQRVGATASLLQSENKIREGTLIGALGRKGGKGETWEQRDQNSVLQYYSVFMRPCMYVHTYRMHAFLSYVCTHASVLCLCQY